MSKQKSQLDELAIFGGLPIFDSPLFVGRPNLGNQTLLLERIQAILDSRWLSNHGAYVQAFEAKLKEITGVKHCIPIANATIALEILFHALGLQPGDEVIVPAYTFVASAHALEWLGIKPVFADISPQSHSLDPVSVAGQITSKTKAILGVHLWGQACAIEELQALADQYHLELCFDAAHAFGSTYRGQFLGHFGRAEVFSFHATKFINAFEGGAIATNDDDLALKLRRMKNFGFTGFDQVESLGTNGKMHEASAAMGLTSLESMAEFIQINQSHYQTYRKGLSRLRGLTLFEYAPQEKNNYQYIVVEVDPQLWQRDLLMHILQAERIIVRRYFYPGCHRMAPYNQRVHSELPFTEQACQNILVFPTGTGVSQAEIETILNFLEFCQNHWTEIVTNYKALRP